MKNIIKCPICFDILNYPVECSKCGGTSCIACSHNNGNIIGDQINCALCRSKSCCKKSINTVKFLDMLKFKCKNKQHGCMVVSD